MKFATSVLAFGQEQWILRNIQNSYPHVDQIYVMYPIIPWSEYNPRARKLYPINTLDIDTIRSSKYMDKITIIEGVWKNETEQRNDCVDKAIEDGINYLMIHDADEFYFNEDFKKIIKRIEEYPSFDTYYVKGIVFWKSFKYVVVSAVKYELDGYYVGGKISGMYEIVINLNNKVRHCNGRETRYSNYFVFDQNDILMYHTSYVASNETILKKISTFGHSNQIDIEKWYNEKWLNWTPETINLHPISEGAHAFIGTELYDGKLPEVIEDLKNYIP